MWKYLRPALVSLILLTVITGIIYPMLVTGMAQLLFPDKANGSLVVRNGKTYGSELIGQQFTAPKYFWSRLSATGPNPYNAGASSGSNLGPLNPALEEKVAARIKDLKSADSTNTRSIPVDLVTASGSGLDPHISVAAAEYQIGRVARARGVNPEQVRAVVARYTESRQLGFLGEPRVNVVKLNLALDALHVNSAEGK
jgi:potassium-transporting ATPase KdpC subunit